MDINWSAWLLTDWAQIIGIIVSSIGIYVGIIVYTRLLGLRSFTKISSYDFAMTVAMGSILASTASAKEPSLIRGLIAIGVLFILQAILSYLRINTTQIKTLVDNKPILLMAHGEYIWENIHKVKLTNSDIHKVLRQNNIKNSQQVLALVMETSGAMSVIKSEDESLDPSLFTAILDWQKLVK